MTTPSPDLAGPVEATTARRRSGGVRWVLFGLGAVLFFVATGPALAGLVEIWSNRPEYSHGFLAPIAAAWLAWRDRRKIRTRIGAPSWFGALLLGFALAVVLAGEMLGWVVLSSYGIVLGLAGLVWGFLGARAAWAAAPAFVALALMCPIPGRIQQQITLPLKRGASLLATGMLNLTGLPAVLEGNLIHLQGAESIWVADACSGLHSLISLGALAILGALVLKPRPWIALVVLLSCVPIAIVVNGLRLWVTGVLAVKVGQETAQGVFHLLEGFGLFLIAALVLGGWAWLLGRLVPRRVP